MAPKNRLAQVVRDGHSGDAPVGPVEIVEPFAGAWEIGKLDEARLERPWDLPEVRDVTAVGP
jgi:hypothetical protein